MTLKQLEAFYWAAKLGTFAIAAQRLHVTQSSLSKRIAELESDLGQQLFDRTARRSMLTAAGEKLLDKAAAMLDLEREIRADSGPSRDELQGACRVGITELTATTWFPSLVARVERDFPLLTLEPQVGLSRLIENDVVRGELDVAILAGPVNRPELRGRAVADIEFIWTSAPVRLPHRTVLQTEHFEAHPVINNPHDSGLSATFESWANTHRIRIGKTIQCNSRAAIIALTIAGVGISFQPRRYVQPLLERGLLVPLESAAPLPRQPYNLVWRADDDRRIVEAIVALVQEEADFDADNLFWGN
ncbi:LysR family transcriptional regulator [[Acidovorax] ebreus]|uniref:Transcriptional regulator, LysR family n=1 Tax=Acidovorax ebreus (strain TPSY) TaxID=535289 RepID=A0A9J9Q452_ACIET|nr:LysR family transcriptional regulator [[Acidovorax] ebreus]ACM31564.1 transcriptional regulator, LysR family [[Acidovorax] ebreus TPSY]